MRRLHVQLALTALLIGGILPIQYAHAQSKVTPKKESPSISRVRSAFDMFSEKINARSGMLDVVSLDEKPLENGDSYAVPTPEKVVEEPKPLTKEEKLEKGIKYYSEDPTNDPIVSPDQRAAVRVMPDAPAPARAMIASYRSGDMDTAGEYADQLVRLQKDFFFEVRQITKLVGQAMVRQKVIQDEDWLGAEQMLEIELARTRNEMNALMRPDHDTAMERITPDPKGKAQIFYFFSMQCSWCRYMGPDIERLNRIAKADPNLSLNVLTIGKAPTDWIEQYKEYTGIDAEILDGEEFARKFDLRFVPALLVISPTNNKAYIKSGQQTFARMYQFIRKVQGLPAEPSPTLQALIETPIGERELKLATKQGKAVGKLAVQKVPSARRKVKKVELATF